MEWGQELRKAARIQDQARSLEALEAVLERYKESVLAEHHENVRTRAFSLAHTNSELEGVQKGLEAALAVHAAQWDEVEECRSNICSFLLRLEPEWRDLYTPKSQKTFVLTPRTLAGSRTNYQQQLIKMNENADPSMPEFLIRWRDPVTLRSCESPVRSRLLSEVKEATVFLTSRYGWSEPDAVTFVLSGVVPSWPLISCQLGQGQTAISSFVRLDVNLAVNGEQLESAYKELRKTLLKHPLRLPGPDALKALRHLETERGPSAQWIRNPFLSTYLERSGSYVPQDDGAVRSMRKLAERRVDRQTELPRVLDTYLSTSIEFLDVYESLLDTRLRQIKSSYHKITRLCFQNLCEEQMWDLVTMPAPWSLEIAQVTLEALESSLSSEDPSPFVEWRLTFPLWAAVAKVFGESAVRSVIEDDWKTEAQVEVGWLRESLGLRQTLSSFLSACLGNDGNAAGDSC